MSHPDDQIDFTCDQPLRVRGNSADMLGASRCALHACIDSHKRPHFGPFDCSPAGTRGQAANGACCR